MRGLLGSFRKGLSEQLAAKQQKCKQGVGTESPQLCSGDWAQEVKIPVPFPQIPSGWISQWREGLLPSGGHPCLQIKEGREGARGLRHQTHGSPKCSTVVAPPSNPFHFLQTDSQGLPPPCSLPCIPLGNIALFLSQIVFIFH